MTPWLIIGAVFIALGYVGYVRSKAKKAGKAEAEGEMLANHAEKMGKINEDDRTWGDATRDPETDAEWDEYFNTGHKPERVRINKSRR